MVILELPANVMVVDALTPAEMLPAASLAQAHAVWMPALPNVTEEGAVPLQLQPAELFVVVTQ